MISPRADFSAFASRACEPDWLRSQLFNMSEALWGTWGKNGTGLTTFMLKQWLKNYSIKPYAVRAGGEPVKGYHVKQFQEKLARYPNGVGDGGGRLHWLQWLRGGYQKQRCNRCNRCNPRGPPEGQWAMVRPKTTPNPAASSRTT